jgi:hypothetical protein
MMDNLENKKIEGIYLPYFQKRVETYLDLFSIFNKKEIVVNFAEYLITRLIAESRKLVYEQDKASLIYIDEKYGNIGIDYGAFIHYLTTWLAEKNNLDYDEVGKFVKTYLMISNQKSFNTAPKNIVTLLFGYIHKMFFVKYSDNFFYTVLVKGDDENLYKLHLIFINKFFFNQLFDEKIRKEILSEIDKYQREFYLTGFQNVFNFYQKNIEFVKEIYPIFKAY